jgi:hypothetical protein
MKNYKRKSRDTANNANLKSTVFYPKVLNSVADPWDFCLLLDPIHSNNQDSDLIFRKICVNFSKRKFGSICH